MDRLHHLINERKTSEMFCGFSCGRTRGYVIRGYGLVVQPMYWPWEYFGAYFLKTKSCRGGLGLGLGLGAAVLVHARHARQDNTTQVKLDGLQSPGITFFNEITIISLHAYIVLPLTLLHLRSATIII